MDTRPDQPSDGPLGPWRARASFDWKRMKIFLEGEETLRLKKEIFNTLERDSLFKKGFKQLSFDEYRELTHRRWKRLLELCMNYSDQPKKAAALAEVLELFDQGLVSRYTLHSIVFAGAVMSTGTERHKTILEAARRNEIVGCFCLTELSHGSNTAAICTTATFDAGEFILHTPSVEATKVWAGNLGMSASHAVVYAQLWVGGRCYGVHSFVIQVRDMKTWKPLPGITIGDMGEKPGQWNAVENGWMTFEHHRAPLPSLLNRGCDVTEDGRYVTSFSSDREKKSVTLGALSIGRVTIIGKGLTACVLAATIAIRYSAVRKQFGPPGEDELPVLSYPLQRRRVLPTLSAAICIQLFLRRFSDTFSKYMERVLKGEKSDELVELSKEVHALSSAAKPRATWLGVHGLAEARAACGGHGMLYCSRLNELRDSFDPTQTFEGENNLLVQQAANYLLAKAAEKGSHKSPMGTSDFLEENQMPWNGKWNADIVQDVLLAYSWLLRHLLSKSRDALAAAKATSKSGFQAKNDTQIDHAHPLAIAYAEKSMIEWAAAAIEEVQEPSLKNVLQKVVRLFGLHLLQSHLATLYIGGYCSGAEFGDHIRESQIAVEEDLAGEAVSLVDAIAPPDWVHASLLGKSDGRVYEALMEQFKTYEGTRPPWTEDLTSFLQLNTAKSKM